MQITVYRTSRILFEATGAQQSENREFPPQIERFSIECRTTKTKAITMPNHEKHKQQNEPMRTGSNYT